MPLNPVVIAGSLSKEELEKSIKEIVKAVDVGMDDVSEKFDTKLAAIEENFKKAGTKIGTAFKDSFNAALGGSFDQLAAAMEKISSSGGKFINIGFGGNSGAKDLLSQIEEIEEQIRDLKIKGITTEEDKARLDAMVEKLQKLQKEKERLEQGAETVEDLDKIIAMEEHRQKKMKLDSAELLKQNELVQEQKDYRKEQLSTEEQLAKAAEKEAEAIERAEAKKLKKAQAPYREELSAANTMPAKDIDQMQQKLERLKRAKDAMRSSGLFDEAKLNRAQTSIDNLEKKIEQIRSKRPKSFAEVMGMDESSIDAITRKMRELKKVKIDTQDPQQVKAMSDAMTGLKKKQSELLGSNIRLTNSNNALARSFGYIRNRLMYAITIGAVMNFVKQMYSVRAEYELLERSMGVLIDNFRRGSEIFNELNAMALKSPFTLVELGTAAKQLLAYNFAEDEVVDTTRRLADISAALGVPMERLVYNLGQIRAQTVLTARDARDFANAGLAIVPMLAKMYTEQKKFGDEIVTTAQVYDMMSKKLVTYEDVMKVINQVTDEGGKFFDFQAKQAETLKVQLANLTLAWNNMLNDIASGHQTALNTPIKLVKSLFQNWRSVLSVIQSLIVAYGIYKTAILAVNSAHAATWALRLQVRWKQYTEAILAATGAMNKLKVAIGTSGLIGLASILAGVASYFLFFRDSVGEAADEIERFGESGTKVIRDVDNLYAILRIANKDSVNYKKVLGELNQILEEYGLQTVKETYDLNALNVSREKNIELLKQEALEREHLNKLSAVNEQYQTDYDTERKRLQEGISKQLIIGNGGFSENARKYSFAISEIIATTVEGNLDAVLNKSGKDFYKGMHAILANVRYALKENEELGLTDIDINRIAGDISGGIAAQTIRNLKERKEIQDGNTKSLNNFYEKEKEANKQTTTFNDKVEQTSRRLMAAANDTDKFYRKIDALVKQYQKKNIIEFLVDVKAQVPDWMMKMGISDLSKFAANFTAIAEQATKQGLESRNVNGKRMATVDIWKQGVLYTEALRQKQEQLNKEREKPAKKDILGDALTKELQLITDIQKLYKEYTKAGYDSETAKNAAAKEYQKTLEQTNKTLAKFGIQGLTGKELATMDLRSLRDNYQSILDKVQSSPKAVEALEKAIRNLNIEITKEGQKTILDSLNSELSKLKDEYELAVDLDANPELGENFAAMFGIVPEALPHTIQEYAERMLDGLNNALKEGKQNLQLPSLFLTPDDINILSELVKEEKLGEGYFKAIMDSYNKFVGLLKSASTDVEKVISDYIKTYGDLSDRLKEIENEKNENLKKLNAEYYTDELKQTEEYAKKRNIILDKANKDTVKATFEVFKKSDDYERFFTAIDTFTKEDATDVKAKIKATIIDTFQKGGLTVSQFRKELKAVEEQFEKLSEPATVFASYIQSGFDGAIKKAKEIGQELEIIGEKIKKDGVTAQDSNFLTSLGKVFDLNGKKVGFEGLFDYFGKNKDLQGLGNAVSKAGSNMASGASKFASAVAIIDTVIKNIHGAVEGVNQILSELNEGRNEYSKIGGWGWDAFSKVDQYAASGWEKLKSGNILGALTDTINSIVSPIASLFRSKDNKLLDQIKESQREVTKLGQIYDKLSDQADKAYGAAVAGAKQAAIENKKLQLVELQRQLMLEMERKEKYQDIDTIISLKGQIASLQREISNSTTDIVNDMLGISSAGDGITSLVETMIDAFKNGEDVMEAFSKKWDEMIDNMVLKLIVSRLLSQKWDEIMQTAKDITQKDLGNLPTQKSDIEKIIQDLREGSFEALNEAAKSWGYTSEEKLKKDFGSVDNFIKSYISSLEGNLSEIDKQLNEASINATQDVLDYMKNDGFNDLKEYMKQVYEALGDYWTFGQNAQGTQLSNLQQGIQSLSEDTGNAIESYLNGISQQIYLHSSQLEEIKALMQGFNFDVQLGVQSQILLELQNSYQVQMSIQNILQGVLTPSGRAFMVEME